MARKRTPTKPRDTGRRTKKKVCVFCKEGVDWIDYKDVNLLRRFLSDRAKIRARRVTGNCAQHQREVSIAIKTARELALLPYTQRVTSTRGAGRGAAPSVRRDEPPRPTTPPPPPPGARAGGEDDGDDAGVEPDEFDPGGDAPTDTDEVAAGVGPEDREA